MPVAPIPHPILVTTKNASKSGQMSLGGGKIPLINHRSLLNYPKMTLYVFLNYGNP